MDIFIDDREYMVDMDQLKSDLSADDCVLVALSRTGELVIDDMSHGEDYPYRREVWYMREPGGGTNNEEWGEQEWEFARSIKLERDET